MPFGRLRLVALIRLIRALLLVAGLEDFVEGIARLGIGFDRLTRLLTRRLPAIGAGTRFRVG